MFASKIDPATLIAAKSVDLSLEDILDHTYTPSVSYRFTYVLQKANEFCNDVKSLGAQLLSVIEKEDAETLSSIRATQERGMQEMITQIEERQILEAKET